MKTPCTISGKGVSYNRLKNCMQTIPLTQGGKAIVDDEDYEMLSTWKWRLGTFSNGYAIANSKRLLHGNTKTVYMHRIIMQPEKGKQVDHINGESLDNRKSNLRFSTQQQNIVNSRKTKGRSKYKGVNPTPEGRWFAVAHKDGERFYLGRFDCEKDAAKAYDKKLIELYGEFACINFPI